MPQKATNPNEISMKVIKNITSDFILVFLSLMFSKRLLFVSLYITLLVKKYRVDYSFLLDEFKIFKVDLFNFLYLE